MSQQQQQQPGTNPLPRPASSLDTLRVLQWNIQGLRGKSHEVLEAIAREGMDIVLLQETLAPDTYTFRVPGYTVHQLPLGPNCRGCMTIVRNVLPHRRLPRPIHCGDGVEVIAVELSLPNMSLAVYNIYRSPSHGLARLELEELLTLARTDHLLVAGDFNAHHPSLHSPRDKMNETGRHVAFILEEVPEIKILNNGDPTHRDGGRLDLTFVSEVLARDADWRVHPTLTSDHFGVVTALRVKLPPRVVLPPRWNTKKADWLTFQKVIEEWWANYVPSLDLDQLEADYTAALTRAADAAIPKSSPHRQDRRDWWFRTDRVVELRRRVKAVRKLYARLPSPATRDLLKEVVAHSRQTSREAKATKWLEWCASFDAHTSLSELWTKLRIATQRKVPAPPAHPHPQEEAERLTAYFAARGSTTQLSPSTQLCLEALRPEREERLAAAIAEQDMTDLPFTMDELRRSRRSRPDTASGSDGITYSMLSAAGPSGDEAFLLVLNTSWAVGRLPVIWKAGDIIVILKRGDSGKLRPITLLRCPAKQAETLVLARLEWKLGEAHPHLFGFTRGRSTADSISTLLALINNRPAVAVFLDMEKAFELANPDSILDLLVTKGVKGRLLAWVADYLRGRCARVKFQGRVASYQDFPNGTPQGGILSPFVFNLLMEALVSLLFPEGVNLLSYADDLVLVVSPGRSNKIQLAQRALDQIATKCEELGLKISPDKTKAIFFNDANPNTLLRINQVRISWVNEHQYLGVWLDKHLSFRTQVAYLEKRISARLNVMRAMTSPQVGASPEILRRFYAYAVRPLVDYSAPVLITLNENLNLRLERLQNRAMRIILGAPSWTCVANMRAETGLVSLESRTRQLVAGRIASILHRGSNTAAGQKFKSPQIQTLFDGSVWLKKAADCLMSLVNFWPKLTKGPDRPSSLYSAPAPWEEPVLTVTFTSLPRPKLMCSSHEMRQSALQGMEVLHSQRSAIYYTDGSVDPVSGRTAAAYVTQGGTVALRTSDHCSSLQTELTGILSALVHAQSRNEANIIVHTDSRSALMVLQQPRQKDNIRLCTTILGLARSLHAAGKRVILNWIPSHVGIKGNSNADEAAKQATARPEVDLVVRPSLRYTKEQARCATWSLAHHQQREARNSFRSAAWYHKLSGGTPLKTSRQCGRRNAVLLHRLRLGYRTWHEREHPEEPRQCEHCGLMVSLPLQHYLLECPSTNGLRLTVAGLTTGPPEDKAANIVRNICESQHPEPLFDILHRYPPPR